MTVTGGELLAQSLNDAGVKEVFTLHGGHLDDFLVNGEKYGIRLTDTRHESSAGHAAEAYARLTGRVGVCVTTSGPGFTNTLTAIANAYLDAIPVVFIVGAPPLREAETNPLQGGFDQIAMAAPVTKWAHQITTGERIPEMVSLAFKHAQSGKPGPVLLELPIDVMFRPVPDDGIRRPSYGERIRSAPTAAQVDAIVAALDQAKRPVLITGGGAMLSGCAAEVVELAERYSMPVFTPNKGDGLIPASHPLWSGGSIPLASLPEAGLDPDLVILLGARMGLVTGARSGPVSTAKLIQVDLDEAEIGRLHDVTIGVVADCRETLRAVLAAAPSEVETDPTWAATVPQVRHGLAALFPDSTTESGRLHPYFAAQEIVNALPPRTVVALDGGEAPAWVAMHLAPEEPNSVVGLGYLGCLGVGQGFAIGAHRADPDRPLLLVTGDGSAAFHIAEFDSMVRHGIPVVTVVFNNMVWGMSIHGQQAVYGDSGVVVSELRDSAYEQAAVAFGGYGERVDRLEDLGPAVRRAFEAGVPVCLNVAIAPEVVHPLTIAMLGDVTSTTEVVVPYYDNLPL